MKLSMQKNHQIPRYEWDRWTRSARSEFSPFLATTAWADLTRNERKHICYWADSCWEKSQAELPAVRYQIKMSVVRLYDNVIWIENPEDR